jgi:hypothetical protein
LTGGRTNLSSSKFGARATVLIGASSVEPSVTTSAGNGK